MRKKSIVVYQNLTKKSSIPNRKDLIPLWKVCISSAHLIGLERSSPLAFIAAPESAFGRARLGVGFFETAQEARNFFLWLQTDLIRFLQASSGDQISSYVKNVPDLDDYTDNNKLFYDSPNTKIINDRLITLYKLHDESQYISDWVTENLGNFSKNPFSGLTQEERKLFDF